MLFALLKHRVRADLRAAPAVKTAFGVVPECIFDIRIYHQITPKSLLTPRTIIIIIPRPAISAMTGTYRKISFFTPVRDVKVVHPVKLRARYAITAGMRSSAVAADSPFTQAGSAGFV
jgi:hypothetical protein